MGRLLGARLEGEQVYEIGWSVLPAFQGRGIAGSATLEDAYFAHTREGAA